MSAKGDTERQAALRDRMIRQSPELDGDRYISKICAVLKPGTRLLDIGCGTAHIIQKLAASHSSVVFVGLDISPAMLMIARANVGRFDNVAIMEADGLQLPFQDLAFDVVITRLAEYSPREACRVLKKRGYFLEYGLGPEANKEIVEFFPDRIEKENFFLPRRFDEWKEKVCEPVEGTGFVVDNIEDYKEDEYYKGVEELADLIEMVPLVRDFDRERDSLRISELAEKYRDKKGIRITWHYYIMEARRT